MSIRSCILSVFFVIGTTAACAASYWKTDSSFTSPVVSKAGPVPYSTTLALPNGGLALPLSQGTLNGKVGGVLNEIKSDGTTDTSFSADATLTSAIPVFAYPDGRLIIRGSTQTDANPKYFRLLSNGTIDAAFVPFVYLFNANYPTIVAQSDGKLLVFENQGTLQRFNSDGSADATFTSPFASPNGISDLSLQNDGKIIVSGTMTVLNSSSQIYFARLNLDGSLDSSFQCPVNHDSSTLGGTWSYIDTNGQRYIYANNLTSSGELYKLDSSGNITASYAPTFPSISINWVLKPTKDGKIYFINSGPSPAQLQRVNLDGTLDSAFSIDLSYPSPPLTWDGTYIYLTDGPPARVAAHNYITQVNSSGNINNAFNPSVGSISNVTSFYRQADGKYFISADADSINSTPSPSGALVRLNSDGSLDGAFQAHAANANSSFVQIQGLSSGAVIGLQENYLSGQDLNLVEQDSSGTIIANYTCPSIYSPTFAADGSYYIYTPPSTASNATLVRYKADGSADNTFAPSATNSDIQNIQAIYPAPNGAVYLQTRTIGLSRLKHDGSADPAFVSQTSPGELGSYSVVLPDSSILKAALVNISYFQNHQVVNTSTTSYTHYDINGNVIYVYEGDYSIFTLAGVLYDRLKAINTSSHAFAFYNNNFPLDIEPNGQLSLLDSTGATTSLVRYIPTNPSQPTVPLAPSFVEQPVGGPTSLGGSTTLSVHTSGLHPFTYQWYFNGKAIAGATADTLVINSITQSNFGDYTVVASNSAGSTTSTVATLSEVSGPNITQQPASVVSDLSASASFNASTDVGFVTYSWQVLMAGSSTWTDLSDTLSIHGSHGSQLTFDSVTADLNGASFRCRILDVLTQGTSYTSAATLTITGLPLPAAKFSNISTRAYVGTGASIEIGGFIVSGTQPKQVLIRGLGPQLTGLGVKNALADPVLKVFSGQTQIATNDDWSSDPTNASAVTNASVIANAMAFPNGSKDSAVVLTLNPGGGYTAQLSGKNGATGIGMIEVYEADSTATDARLINISTRSQTQTGSGIQIAGFIISGNQSKKVLIRALGPTLTQYSVNGVLDDPVLSLFSGQTKIGENDDWSSTTDNTTAVEAATTGSNAVALTRGTTDSAMVVTLAPGGYTAQVSGKSGHTGVTLIEVYEVP
ncbi:MAG TPA: immunoglobulin domain-containing protein [Opitutaceae bacterium]